MRAPAIFLSLPSPGPSWPMRLACLALLSPLLAQAQGPSAPDATRADAPTAPLPYSAMPPQPPLVNALPSPQAWRQAHEAVGAFPRGHADIVASEAQGGSAPPPRARSFRSSPRATPPTGHATRHAPWKAAWHSP